MRPLDDQVRSSQEIRYPESFASAPGLVTKGGTLQVRFLREGLPTRGFAAPVDGIPLHRNLGDRGQVILSIPMEALTSLLGAPVKVMVDEQTNILHLIAMPEAKFEVEVEEECPAGLPPEKRCCDPLDHLRCQVADARVHAAVSCMCSAGTSAAPVTCDAHKRLIALETELAAAERRKAGPLFGEQDRGEADCRG
jgi:hypothetical protein